MGVSRQVNEGSVATNILAARVEITIFDDNIFIIFDLVGEVVDTARTVQRKLLTGNSLQTCDSDDNDK